MSRSLYLQRCSECPATFFTSGGLYEHVGETHRPPPAPKCRQPHSPAQREAWKQAGHRVAALNNTRKRRCDDCGLTATCAALGTHQKHTGHKGWAAA